MMIFSITAPSLMQFYKVFWSQVDCDKKEIMIWMYLSPLTETVSQIEQTDCYKWLEKRKPNVSHSFFKWDPLWSSTWWQSPKISSLLGFFLDSILKTPSLQLSQVHLCHSLRHNVAAILVSRWLNTNTNVGCAMVIMWVPPLPFNPVGFQWDLVWMSD